MSLIEDIKQNEGFEGMPYTDSLGYETIGYGTKLPISKVGAEYLAKLRLNEKIERLHKKLDWLENQPSEIKEILYEMAYQLGVTALMKFKITLTHIKVKEYVLASAEMLDSRWANQTPDRAYRLAMRMREVKDGNA